MTLLANSLACVRGERPIFAGLSFKLVPGDILLISGRNGAGKSSLLRIITGLLPMAHGDILWKGKNLHQEPHAFRQDMHYIGHKNPVKDRLSVLENLRFWAKSGLKRTKEQLNTAIEQALDSFDLSEFKDVPARMLSSGQRRRLTLTRLMVEYRVVWILDEPGVGLDRASLSKLEIMIEDHRRSGGIVLITTHARMTLLNMKKLDVDRFAPAGAQTEHVEEDART